MKCQSSILYYSCQTVKLSENVKVTCVVGNKYHSCRSLSFLLPPRNETVELVVSFVKLAHSTTKWLHSDLLYKNDLDVVKLALRVESQRFSRPNSKITKVSPRDHKTTATSSRSFTFFTHLVGSATTRIHHLDNVIRFWMNSISMSRFNLHVTSIFYIQHSSVPEIQDILVCHLRNKIVRNHSSARLESDRWCFSYIVLCSILLPMDS